MNRPSTLTAVGTAVSSGQTAAGLAARSGAARAGSAVPPRPAVVAVVSLVVPSPATRDERSV
ncbi:hypothetical protein ABTZ59_35860 [Streptomyces sp. NPDC094034]|uniref:hypothetical protein n=1 Tax=Streptomyces sp. NPDC094034 TaxID=3155309 RepID=UPI00332FCC9F